MTDFHPMRQPDYAKQAVSAVNAPVGDIFEDVNKRPPLEKQGDPIPASGSPVQDDFEAEPRGRIPREASGATSARSGSVSRSRDRSTVTLGFNPDSNFRGGATNGNAQDRHASLSPTRAMGARSVSIERNSWRQRSGLDTLEGIGASVDTGSVVNPEALEDGRGRRGRADVVEEEERGRGETAGSSSARVLSPHRAMGARSASITRNASADEDRGRGDSIGSSAARVLSPHRAMGARSASATRNASTNGVVSQ